MSNQKILILGNRGMLGQELVRVFGMDSKYVVTGWDYQKVDITNQKNLEQKITALQPNIIINAAAYNAVDKAEESAGEYQKAKLINGEAVGYLATICRKMNTIFVHYSTDYVFGNDKNKYDENDRPNPLSNYGRSKLLGEEKILAAYAKNNPQSPFYLIRLSKLFGQPGQAKQSFFDLMLKLGHENPEVKAVDDEKSCFTYAPDLARATKKLIKKRQPAGIYHITNTNPCTWYQAVLTLYKIAKLKTKVIPVPASAFPRPAPRPHSSILLNTKLKPLRGYEEALKEYLKRLTI